jgi:hypothetical protein
MIDKPTPRRRIFRKPTSHTERVDRRVVSYTKDALDRIAHELKRDMNAANSPVGKRKRVNAPGRAGVTSASQRPAIHMDPNHSGQKPIDDASVPARGCCEGAAAGVPFEKGGVQQRDSRVSIALSFPWLFARRLGLDRVDVVIEHFQYVVAQ